jgi:4-carboxymuconolactone decarboxylase
VSRIAKLTPAQLDGEQRALYEAITGGRRAQGRQAFRLMDEAGRLEGPFNAFLLQPRLGSALQALGASVRYDTGLDDRCREIAILIVARHWHSEFEWRAHEAVGRSVGVSDADLAAVRGRAYDALDAGAAAVARTVDALVSVGDLGDDDYAAAIAAVGPAGLFELLTLVGYYAALALQLRVFRVEAESTMDDHA